MRQQITRFVKLFTPKPEVQLGRWRLKHDQLLCDKYLTNNYADPGYPNCDKRIWIEKFKDDENIEIIKYSK